jgi:hypothetical protein
LFGDQFNFSGNFDNGVTFHVWDFEVTSDISNFTLTLSGTVPFAYDQTLAETGQQVYGYGLFLCMGSDTNTPVSGDQICTTSGVDTSGVTPMPSSPYTSGSLSSVSFNVSGDGQGLVFYVMENLNEPDLTITATLTPEPASLPFLAAVGLAIVVLGRRRLAKRL